jgi:hypothetical protein
MFLPQFGSKTRHERDSRLYNHVVVAQANWKNDRPIINSSMVHLLASGPANGGLIEQALPFNLVLFGSPNRRCPGLYGTNSTKYESQFVSPIFTPQILIGTMQQQWF